MVAIKDRLFALRRSGKLARDLVCLKLDWTSAFSDARAGKKDEITELVFSSEPDRSKSQNLCFLLCNKATHVLRVSKKANDPEYLSLSKGCSLAST